LAQAGDTPAFLPMDRGAYGAAARLGRVPMAAGESHDTHHGIATAIEDGDVTLLQPDLPETGGVTDGMRIAAIGSACKLTINPHTSATAIDMATAIRFLCGVDHPGQFEGGVTSQSPFGDPLRFQLACRPARLPGRCRRAG
jgi:L-alanine-DL-glutamate epimerase-like enolase superfamily enzyme